MYCYPTKKIYDLSLSSLVVNQTNYQVDPPLSTSSVLFIIWSSTILIFQNLSNHILNSNFFYKFQKIENLLYVLV